MQATEEIQLKIKRLYSQISAISKNHGDIRNVLGFRKSSYSSSNGKRSAKSVNGFGSTTPTRKEQRLGTRGSTCYYKHSVSDLTVHPELIEALSSIEENFSRSPLTEEERKIAINSCPRTSSINYNPPALNDSASSAVKKADSVLYGIQIQGTQIINTEDDVEVVFASILRVILFDIAATVTQQNTIPKDTYNRNTATAQSTNDATTAESNSNRTSDRQLNFHRRDCGRCGVAQTDGHPMGLEHSDTEIQNPLHQPKYTDVAQDASAFWRRGRPFRATTDVSPASVQTEIEPGSQQGSDGGSRLYAVKTCDRENQTTESWILQPVVHDPQEDQGSPTCPRPAQAQLPLPCLSIRAITEPIGIHQDSPSISGMGQSEGDRNICIPRRSVDPGRDQAKLGFKVNSYKSSATPSQSITHLEMRALLGRSNQCLLLFFLGDPCFAVSWSSRKSAVHIEAMEIDRNSEEACNPEPAVLEEPNGVMERAVILAQKTKARDLYILQCTSMQRATDGTLCSEAQDGCEQIVVSLFRKHNHIIVHQEVKYHNLLRTIGNLRTNLVTLPENQNPPTTNIHTITSKPSGCAEQTDSADRIFIMTEDIRYPEYTIQFTRCRSVRVPPEREAEPVLQLVSRPKCIGTECTSLKMIRVQQPLLLTALESDITGYSESLSRTNHNGTGYSNVEVSILVHISEGTFNISADHTPSNDCSPRSQKRKISALEKQALELDFL
ncbi:hypothetical protein AYI70_g8509 [Smittium culicis]|uniref:Uncharacterized protein n=1 Tax=Smittium culicis TaxID=133412 RepID=A0A1R1XFJ5_9FUNG|nr:hypothetical protein AYI70_g8509 [Smittium culicis]